MEYGYARVSMPSAKSRKDQHVDNQVERLKAAGIPRERIFVDNGKSGRQASRPGWDECLTAMGAGDTLVVTKLDRIGRSLMNLVGVATLLSKRAIDLRCLDQGLIDTRSATGKLFFQIMSVLAEFEADMTRERTLEGLEAARERRGGKLPTRKPSFTDNQRSTAEMLARTSDLSGKDIAEVIGVSRATLYRHVPIAEIRAAVAAEAEVAV